MTFTIGVIQFPGSNCERETTMALQRARMQSIDIFWFDSIEKLQHCDGYVIVGGFSFEDRSRSGVIAAKDPMMHALILEAKKGKPIIGICNGAQILVESGLVPGCVDENNELKIAMALARNARGSFYNAWVNIALPNMPTISLPVAHAEGRFIVPDVVWELLQTHDVMRGYYVDDAGKRVSDFPVNPNGSDYNLAAVGNFSGNVLAIMPHPERTTSGDVVFLWMKKYLETSRDFCWIVDKFNQKPSASTHETLCSKKYFVKLLIQDNEAISVNMALQKMHIDVAVQRYRLWTIDADKKDFSKIENACELWNPKKEKVMNCLPEKADTEYLLVTEANATTKTLERLREIHGATSLKKLTSGVAWQLTGSKDAIARAINTNLFFNPVSQNSCVISCDGKTARPSSKRKRAGKVRELYDEGDTLIIKTTNRMTAFDRYLCDVPEKNRVLTLLSAWWFEKTKHIVPNHFIGLIDDSKMRVQKCCVLPIEVVVRGFLTGSTNTSIWSLYEKGQRVFFDTTLPDGLIKNAPLSQPIVTPTTKSATHDEPLTMDALRDIVSNAQWKKIKSYALKLFSFGQKIAYEKGFILVDTKYEFGLDAQNEICLIDECHTPDSSRFWLRDSIEHYDKEYLRLWYKTQCDPYRDATLPTPPKNIIAEMSRRYVELYEKITG